ncbi:hypothetical protein DYD83_01335 [Dickeya fangzhongdai]|uniref:Uncharacterized protein n=1 Tax=Dickeya fangzhongdai TaxID=1778540 RepID=A0A2K8QH16_9GAMM|nr:hypothetical protein CVE23_01300 [Dickeya fangzhongdai]QOH46160.1 hypothetical protein DYD82_01325 [Dickeya fangzhongdai]QOH50468.1 hypothetical protein DYD83_01335 [Dickeya fangzhongdai]
MLSIECDGYAISRHTSSHRCVGFPRSPHSLTQVSSRGFAASPPSCNSNYLGGSSTLLHTRTDSHFYYAPQM